MGPNGPFLLGDRDFSVVKRNYEGEGGDQLSVQFYVHSDYSLLQSALTIERLVKRAEQLGIEMLALTDYNTTAGHYEFQERCKRAGIKPILGLELSVQYQNAKEAPVVLIAVTQLGYENLLRLASLPVPISYANLVEFKGGLALLEGVGTTPMGELLAAGRLEDAMRLDAWYKKQFGPWYYLRWQAGEREDLVNHFPDNQFILCRDVRYAHPQAREILEVMAQIGRIEPVIPPHPMLGWEELQEKFTGPERVVEQTLQLAKACDVQLRGEQVLPPHPSGQNLTDLAFEGARERYGEVTEAVRARLVEELTVIEELGFADYFLIVADIVRSAKEAQIPVGPGRGSAAGSLVAYCLGITEVDPIEYDLLFERFLNIDRRSMPDIDLDFPDIKRDLVINYVKEKYGKNHVVTMTTFTNLTTKTSMRDIARQMQLSQERINAIIASHAKGILDETDKEAMRLIEVAQTIEGIPRQTGTHPAGIILSKNDLTKRIPLMLGPKDIYQSQLEASDLENLGFLKIDFLGLKNLTMIEDILKLIQKPLKLSDIPLNDKKTFDMLSNADVEGVFQLESSGMRRTLLKLKPSTFEDIVAILALYRPGPMQFIDDYIARRHGKSYEKIDPEMDEILKNTYGIIVYQEQIMKILQTYAGYSLSQADIIRRAISKKDHQLIEQERMKFIESAKKLNKPVETAIRIYNHIEKFADYGFNRSHSVAYAFIAYHMAYLKAHYYPQFMSVLMSQNVSNTGYLKTLVDDVIAQGIDVLPPNINVSKLEFMPYKNGLLAPLTVIKGIGLNTAKKIIELQPFTDYDDFKIKVKDVINEQTIQTLIYAGALDSFKLNRATLLDQNNLDQTGFENFLKDYQTPNIEELPFIELKNQELQTLGFNLKYLKDEHLEKLMKQYKIQPMTLEHQSIRTIGVIENVKIIHTKKGDPMAFVTLNNGITLDLTVFPNQYKAYQSLLSDRYIYIEATKDSKQNKANKYIVRTIKKVKE